MLLRNQLLRIRGNVNLVRQISTSSSRPYINQTGARKQFQFDGKVAIITGGTKGIGLASARTLAQQGCSVMVCGRTEASVEAALKEMKEEGLADKVKGLVAHVGKDEDRQRLVGETVAKFGGIDFLVNVAGVNPIKKEFGGWMTKEFSSSQWDKLFDINVKAPVFLINMVAEHMKERGGGAIVNLSSLASVYPTTFLGPYGASKAALNFISRIQGSELSQYNIRLNTITAGLVKTDFTSQLTPEMLQMSLLGMGATKLGSPEEISSIVSFLLSEESSFMSGGVIDASGGVPNVLRLI